MGENLQKLPTPPEESQPEFKFSEQQILNTLALISHQTWMRQCAISKGRPIESLPKEVSDGDRERAADAWRVLKETRPETRSEAVRLVALSSHNMWLKHKEQDRLRINGPKENLDSNPNDHDIERANDIVTILETLGVLPFRTKG